jgi:signal transduction histidine kinase
MPDRLTVLLVEDNPGDARLVRALLDPSIRVVHETRLAAACHAVRTRAIDAVLLDLSLPDAEGETTVTSMLEAAPGLPVVVLTGRCDEALELAAVRAGAQDDLAKDGLDEDLLRRTLRHAVERARLLRELDELRRQQVRSKDELLAHVSHELRTPLNAAYQLVTIVADGIGGPVTGEQSEYLGRALRNVGQMRMMIDDLLEATRMEVANLRIECRATALDALLRAAVMGREAGAAAADVRLELRCSSLPSVWADPQRVAQVVANLIDNALRYTPRGGVVSVQAACADAEFVQVTVDDTGPGVPADQRTRVFERFAQVDDGSGPSRRGLGLGLYICHELVTRQGGRIWAESAPGAGGRFAFTLPREGSHARRPDDSAR